MVWARWGVLAAGLLLALIGATWGTGVFGSVGSGGFYAQNNESARVRAQVVRELGPQDADVLALYSSANLTVDDPGFAGPVKTALARVAADPQVASVRSFYATGLPVLVSHDRHATYAIVALRGGTEDAKLRAYRAIKSDFTARASSGGTGVTTQLGGVRAFVDESNRLTAADIKRAESFSMPILLVLMVIIFGSVVAAASPLVIGGLAILGGFIVVRMLTYATSISTFAVNIITLIGLGLSIDYSLFVVSRFREELATGRSPHDAAVRTMATAGRTVAVSGLTVTLALAALLVFPQGFLKSMAYGGMSAVVVAMVASLSVLPAGLAVLGPRINAWRVPVPWSRPAAGTLEHGAWARLAHSVMRRPWAYLIGVLGLLLVLAIPVLDIHFGGVDVRVLPTSATSRIVENTISARFPATTVSPVQVLVIGPDRGMVLGQIRSLPHVSAATMSTARGDSALIDVDYAGDDPTSAAAADVVHELRALRAPPGTTIGVTGYTADLVDQLASLGDRLPWMVGVVVSVTLVLLFLAFGSVVLPVKAVLMNVVSLGAAFGAVVFVFQQGHLVSWLGFTPTGSIEPTNPILMIAVLFGLATDYEVFLLSRIREEWDAGADNRTAVATGLQRTGRIITSAALLLVIVVIGFTIGRIAFVKLIGVGMIVAIIVDATLVRALLVPATMRLLGRWNWWAPGPLARFYRRYGVRESSGPQPPVTGHDQASARSTTMGA